jgi:hypothetical protein
MLGVKKRFDVRFGQGCIQHALHRDPIGGWVETDKDAKWEACVFIAESGQGGPFNGQAICWIDD